MTRPPSAAKARGVNLDVLKGPKLGRSGLGKLQPTAKSDAATPPRAHPAAARGKVCAIVPTFNRAALLKECLDSLLTQSRVPDQIIVVNDGSTDETEAVAKAYGAPVEVLTKANGGKAAALNYGLAHCRGDYVWVCDDDDLAAPDSCATMSSALDANPGAAFVYGRFDRFRDTPNGREIMEASYWPDAIQSDLFLALAERFFVCQFSMMVRRSAYDAVGPFREDLIRSQDYEMTLRLARHGEGVLAPGILFHQRQHEGARGTRAEQFDPRASAAKWLEYDRAFFVDLLAGLSDEQLAPPFARGGPPSVQARAGRLQRACINAKRALWDEAAVDIAHACRSGGNEQPLPGELALAGRMLADDLQSRLLDEQHRGAQAVLRQAHAEGRYGRLVLEAMQGPARWKAKYAIRTRDLALLRHCLRLTGAIVGPAGALRVFLRKPG